MKIPTKILKTVTDILAMHSTDAAIVPSEEGWTIKVIDPARVSLANLFISKEKFTDYETCDKFVIDTYDLREALKYVGDEVEIVKKDGKIDLISDHLTQHLKLIINDATIPNIPEFKDVSCTVMVDSAPLSRLLKAAGTRMDYCRLETDESGLKFIAKSSKDDIEIMVPAEECISVEGSAKCSYPLEYFQKFISYIPKGEIPEIKYSTDFPLTMEFGDQDFKVRWVVAPRIEDDE